MTTMDEFNKITQIMYDEGYVMVNLYDLADVDENGKMQAKQVYLPKGKTPFVLSQDDVCYYHSQDGDGIATKLVIDEEGKVQMCIRDRVQNHVLIYHTLDGDFETKGTMRDTDNQFDPRKYFRCNRCYLVNLEFVETYQGSDIMVNGDTIQVLSLIHILILKERKMLI